MRVIVVGTGVAGASCAYALARQGVEVVTVESGRPGQATAAGAGILQPWSSAAVPGTPWYELYLAGAAYYPTLIDRLTRDGVQDIGYARTGSLVVSADRDQLDDVEARVAAHGPERPEVGEVHRLDPVRARALFPPLAEHLSAVHITGGARVDGRRLRAGLLDGARRHGALARQGDAELVVEGGAVTGVRVTGEHAGGESGSDEPGSDAHVGGEHGSGETIAADIVVAAAGAWTNAVLAPLGLRVPVEPQRGQIVHLRLPGVDTGNWPTVLPMGPHYLVCFDDRVVVGATRETGSGFDVQVTAAGLHEVLTAALSVAPGLSTASHLETRVGLRPLTPDQSPHVGFVPGVPGLAMLTGFGAAGLTMGPNAGEIVADLIRDRTPSLDVSALAPTTTPVD
ncbi:NAD(P)/FAD-dependent oxidoreductase [Rugosimonospora africana]|nr:FAD-binding oxidoreductase [Rugosimonospora africana]